MKSLSLITIFFALISSTLFANSLSVDQQDMRMQEIAKQIRRQYYIWRHEDVSSHITRMSEASLDHHLFDRDDRRYETSLDESEVQELKECLTAENKCSLYLVWVSGSYMGGYGEVAHFIMLDISTGRYKEVFHTVYAE